MRRNTIQRRIILDALKSMPTHPTVEDVYVKVHEIHPTISKATVYRNLHQLASWGEIRHIFLPDEPDRFDGRTDPHYHFKCKICGCITDVEVAYLSQIDEAAQQTYGFQVDGHDLVFHGACRTCKALAPE